MSELLMALLIPPGGSVETADSDPVLVEVTASEVIFIGDAGEQLIFDRAEFEDVLARASNKGRAAA